MYLPEWLKFKIVTTPNASKDVEKRDPSRIAGGNAQCAATMATGLVDSYKNKHEADTAIVLLSLCPRKMKT